MDEKGFMIGTLLKTKRIFARSEFERGMLLGAGQDGNRQWITLIATICQDCTFLPPLLIYDGALGNVQDTWLEDFNPAKQEAFFSGSPNGWITDELGYQWLTSIFDRTTRKKARNGREY